MAAVNDDEYEYEYEYQYDNQDNAGKIVSVNFKK